MHLDISAAESEVKALERNGVCKPKAINKLSNSQHNHLSRIRHPRPFQCDISRELMELPLTCGWGNGELLREPVESGLADGQAGWNALKLGISRSNKEWRSPNACP